MTTEIVTQPILDGAHFSIAELMLCRVREMLKMPLNIESYSVNTEYSNRETLTLTFPGDVKLTVSLQRPK